METWLDGFDATFLHAAVYVDRELCVTVAEGYRAAEPGEIMIGGHFIKSTYALDTSEKSRRVEIRFSEPVAWQLVDESFTASDDYEVREDRFGLQVLSRSKYLDYVRANHGWFDEMRGPAKHYRVWTENEVVDVISCEPPAVVLREEAGFGPEADPAAATNLTSQGEGAFKRLQ
jgi:hypothetical protein